MVHRNCVGCVIRSGPNLAGRHVCVQRSEHETGSGSSTERVHAVMDLSYEVALVRLTFDRPVYVSSTRTCDRCQPGDHDLSLSYAILIVCMHVPYVYVCTHALPQEIAPMHFCSEFSGGMPLTRILVARPRPAHVLVLTLDNSVTPTQLSTHCYSCRRANPAARPQQNPLANEKHFSCNV